MALELSQPAPVCKDREHWRALGGERKLTYSAPGAPRPVHTLGHSVAFVKDSDGSNWSPREGARCAKNGPSMGRFDRRLDPSRWAGFIGKFKTFGTARFDVMVLRDAQTPEQLIKSFYRDRLDQMVIKAGGGDAFPCFVLG